MPTEPTALPKNYLRSCLLLLLRERAAHGYDLLERLRPFGITGDDPGRLYRALRGLEEEGLVRSAWERSEGGPDRRTYEVTRAGKEALHRTATALAGTRMSLTVFLSRYEEFVALQHVEERPLEAAPDPTLEAAPDRR